MHRYRSNNAYKNILLFMPRQIHNWFSSNIASIYFMPELNVLFPKFPAQENITALETTIEIYNPELKVFYQAAHFLKFLYVVVKFVRKLMELLVGFRYLAEVVIAIIINLYLYRLKELKGFVEIYRSTEDFLNFWQ